MKRNPQHNFAFIDAQNLTMGIRKMGWELDWHKFAIYLADKYHVNKAFVFIGYLPGNEKFYTKLRSFGFILIFKPITYGEKTTIKGNCDGDMIMYIVSKLRNYAQAVVVTSDGDFYSTVRLLYRRHKLRTVLSPNFNTCSKLLNHEARGKIVYMNELHDKLARDFKMKKHR
jgi:uncharacterized LabA/DUF88 family protein